MAYQPHLRATFKGSFRSSASAEPYEYWNTSMALSNPGVTDTAALQAIANDLRQDFAAFMTGSVSGFFGPNTYLDEVRLDSVGANGRITRDAVFARVEGNPVKGGGMQTLPPQCALVLTLDTGTRGRSRFGRMFLPCVAIVMKPDGLMEKLAADQFLAAAKTFVENAGNLPGFDGDFGVVVASGVGEGSLNRVQSIRVGRAVDTMRSRRRSLDEAYVTATVSV